MAEYEMCVIYKILGGHTHMTVRTGKSGFTLGACGGLTMTNEEFSAWRNHAGAGHAGRIDGAIRIQFREEPNGESGNR